MHFNWDGFFWYSEKKRQLAQQHKDYHLNYCNIGGKIQPYTEWKSGRHMRKPSNWNDAICLGYGFVCHEKSIPVELLKSFQELKDWADRIA